MKHVVQQTSYDIFLRLTIKNVWRATRNAQKISDLAKGPLIISKIKFAIQ
jgi:hypothetical protein